MHEIIRKINMNGKTMRKKTDKERMENNKKKKCKQ